MWWRVDDWVIADRVSFSSQNVNISFLPSIFFFFFFRSINTVRATIFLEHRAHFCEWKSCERVSSGGRWSERFVSSLLRFLVGREATRRARAPTPSLRAKDSCGGCQHPSFRITSIAFAAVTSNASWHAPPSPPLPVDSPPPPPSSSSYYFSSRFVSPFVYARASRACFRRDRVFVTLPPSSSCSFEGFRKPGRALSLFVRANRVKEISFPVENRGRNSIDRRKTV